MRERERKKKPLSHFFFPFGMFSAVPVGAEKQFLAQIWMCGSEPGNKGERDAARLPSSGSDGAASFALGGS